jgi:hypothetical protein
MPSPSARHPAAAPLFGPLSARRYSANGVDFDMVRVPPGRFISSVPNDADLQRQTLLSYPFEIGVFQVSGELWETIVPSSSREEGDEIKFSENFNEIDLFCKRLSGLGLGFFRPPTTAELVWAAHCGVPAYTGATDRPTFNSLRRIIKKQGDGKVGAAGVFDQLNGFVDVSCEGPIRFGHDEDNPYVYPLNMVDPVFLSRSTYARHAMGGRALRQRMLGIGRVESRPVSYNRAQQNVLVTSSESSFRLVRVPSSLKLEDY